MDRYVVFGNPIGHSKSPLIHRLFAEQTGAAAGLQHLAGAARRLFRLVPRRFSAKVAARNVTVPFKEEAYRLADSLTAAGATGRGGEHPEQTGRWHVCWVTTPTAPGWCAT